MATVVNTRDVQILATTPRVLGVQMNSNIQISQDNVTGLGIVVDGTKQIWLSSTTQVFQIPKSGSTTPSSVTLTANVRNLTATPTLSLISGTMSVTPVLTAGVFTYTPDQQTSDVVTFRLTLTQDGKTYTDDLTIIKVREGIDSVTGLLTNENFSLPADYLGNVTSYAGCNGNFKVYQGSTDVTSVCTFTIPAGGNPDSLTVSLTGSGAGAGTYSITGGYPTAKDITTLTIRCTFGSTVIDKVMSIAKAKAGVNGATAKQLVMNVSAQSFTFNGDGVAVPSTQIITLFAASQNLSGSPTFSATGYNASGTSIGTLTLSGTGTTRTIDLAAFGAAQYAIVTVTWDGLTDNTTLVRLKDGASNVIGYLTNEAYTVATAADGSGGTYTAAGGTFKVFDGLTDMTGNAAVTYSVQSSSGVSISIAATGVYTVTGTTADQGNATLRAVYKGVTVDKSYTIARSKQGAQGANGSNGSNGQRGSRTFYVAIAGSTWSDSTATTAASTDGGPVINDIVCEFNNAVNFSQTRFWTGSSWTIINAVVDGNLLVSGTVGAKALTLNSGGGNNVWIDSNYTDINAWQVSNWGVLPTQATVTDGIAGGTTLRSPTGSNASARGAFRVPVTVGKQYRISAKVRKSATANGTLYIRLDTGTARTGAYGEVTIGIEGVSTVPTSWTEYAATWTATTPFVSPMVLVNHTGTAGYMEAQDIRIEELTDSALIVVGGIAADRIDSRGLSIKDALGNVILAAGSALDWSMVAGQPLDKMYSADIASQYGLNPSLVLWPTADAYPTGWGSWAGTAPTRETAINRNGQWGCRYTTTGVNAGFAGIISWTAPLPADSFFTGSIDLYLHSVTSGKPGALIRVYTAADLSTYVDTQVVPASSSTGSWQRVPFIARVGAGQQIYGVRVYLMASWTGFATGAFTGSVTYGGIELKPELSGMYGAVIGTNLSGQFNSGNISTFFASAAIGLAQINTATITNLSALSATIGTLRTATSGGRVEIMDNKIYVYDTSNALRVKIGYLL